MLIRRAINKLKRVYGYRRIKHVKEVEWKAGIGRRTISLGKFFEGMSENGKYSLKDLTFIPGGSQVLDYLLLKEIAVKYDLENYLEIGTYIGESISCMEDVCKKRISITLPPAQSEKWFEKINTGNFANRLIGGGITQYLGDSKKFDFNKIKEPIGLYFIDGDHSYEGVYCDTKKVFRHKNRDSFVIWHDFRLVDMSMRNEVIQAVADAIGLEQFGRVYCCDNNLCGIYVPAKYQKDFDELCRYDKDILYIYDIKLEMKRK